jgi:hypothetical protein
MATILTITGNETGDTYTVYFTNNDHGEQPQETTKIYSSWDELVGGLKSLGVPGQAFGAAQKLVSAGHRAPMNFPDDFLHFPEDFFPEVQAEESSAR